MNSDRRVMLSTKRQCPGCGRAAFARVILDDHMRLPWRFFGRLTAAVQAGLHVR